MPLSLRTFTNKWSRKLHRWGAIVVALPLILIISTGLLLQVKKQVSWVQPPTQAGVSDIPTLTFDEILQAARAVPEASIHTWDDIDRLDVRLAQGIIKVRAKNRYEIQLDAATGDVLQIAYRRSDLIESLHDGSFFHDRVKLYIFLPVGAILLALWLTGLYLWILPISAKRAGQRRRARA